MMIELSQEECFADEMEYVYHLAKESLEREPSERELEAFYARFCERYYYDGIDESEENN